jgi:hypothetical protein
MKLRRLALLVLVVACRTARPAGEQPLAPLTATSTDEAAQQLAARRDAFTGARSLVRIRSMNGAQTVSAKAQIQVGAAGDMLITVYTPLNTTAGRLYASNGQVVFVNDVERTAWKGSAAELGGSFQFLAGDPLSLAYLLLGLPPRGDATLSFAPAGLQSARYQDLIVAFDPPAYPPQRAVIVRGTQRVEIDYLESFASPARIEPLAVPAEYRCCVMPQL